MNDEPTINIQLIIDISNHAQRMMETLPDTIREIFIYGDVLYAYFQQHPEIDICGPPIDYSVYLAYHYDFENALCTAGALSREMEERRIYINYYVIQWDIYFTQYEEHDIDKSLSIDLDRFYNLETMHISQIYTYEIINLPVSLSKLLCKACQLRKLGYLPSDMYMLNCSGNELYYLPQLCETRLNALFCGTNKLRALPKLPATLECLHCFHNYLNRLPKLPDVMTDLSCGNNAFRELPEIPNKMQNLYCAHNMLTRIPILPKSMVNFFCQGNQIRKIENLPPLLKRFSCEGNPIIDYGIIPPSVNYLNIDGEILVNERTN